MTLPLGARLGPYEIVAPLGAGGMGEVYRARDTRLGREVAIKVLPAEVANDPERLRRFEQEAKAVSALNHPHIVTLYEVGESPSGPYLVLEKIEGHSLRELLRDGALPVKRVLQIGAQIAEGLAKAHAAGIVHRDLKPENVMVTEDGFAKILDFGLAKLVYPEIEGGTPHDMTTLIDKTASGMILGTLGYLSPEQAAGKPADFRSDQFALGALLYELATGERPFKRETTPESLAAVIREEPEPLRAKNAALPPQLGWIVERCLSKDPNDRYASTKDLSRDLADLRDHLSEVARGVAPIASEEIPHRDLGGARLAWSVAAVATLAALIFAALHLRGGARPEPGAGSFRVEPLTQLPGVEEDPAISPDGKSVVYVRDGDLWLQRVGGSRATNLTADLPGDASAPAFAPDGSRIAFDLRAGNEQEVFVMGATGENPRRVASHGWRPAWAPDGRELVITASRSRIAYEGALTPGLEAVDLASGAVRKLCNCVAASPSVSPHALRVVFWGTEKSGSAQRDLWSVPLAGLAPGDSPVRLTDDAAPDWSPQWTPDGRAIEFVSDRAGTPNLWRLPMDERSGRATGPPEPLTLPASSVVQVRAAADGATRVFEAGTAGSQLLKAEIDATTGEMRGAPQDALRFSHFIWGFEPPAFSPEGTRLVIQGGASGNDILIVSLDGSEVRRLSEGQDRNRRPSWSPDGRTIAFASDRSGRYAIWGVATDGGDLHRLMEAPVPLLDPAWSPDGTALLAFELLEGGARFQPVLHRLGEPAERIEIVPNPPGGANFDNLVWSPRGASLLGDTARGEFWRWTVADKSFHRVEASSEVEHFSLVQELRDGRLLLIGETQPGTRHSSVAVLEPATGKLRILATLDDLFGVAVQPDEKAIWFNQAVRESDLWIARPAAPSP